MSHNANLPPTLSADQAAQLLGCHKRTLLRKCREGSGPPCRKVGRSPIFSTAAVFDWLTRLDTQPTAYHTESHTLALNNAKGADRWHKRG
ncbi:MAG: helix-turn-helix domain-containing protein, partial [Gammaproteobacteria bacterium]